MNKQEELFPKKDEEPTNYVRMSLPEIVKKYKPTTEAQIRDAVSLPVGETDKLEPFESVEFRKVTPRSYDGLDHSGLINADKPYTGEDVMNSKGFYTRREVTTQGLVDAIKEYAIISIDPGSSGSITVFQPTGEIISTKMPDTPKDVFDLLKEAKNNYSVTCYMEKVQGLPGMGGSPMFNFGKGYGHLEMALLALEIQTVTIRPQEWQKTLGIGTKGKTSTTEWKNKLKAKAQQLFPSVKVTLWNADALLIGWYAQNLKK